MKCENCGKEHNGSYGSGRFCCQSCARSFSTSKNRDIINNKRSNALLGHSVSNETRQKISKNNKSGNIEIKAKISTGYKDYWNSLSEIEKESIIAKRKHGLNKHYFKKYNSILDVSLRTVYKILDRMQIGCLICGWNEAHCDIHHINGRKIKDANSMKNLTYICPNCHRLVHSNKIDKSQLISLADAIGESWLDFYFN
jgi:ribosomal protein L37AE/L43A